MAARSKGGEFQSKRRKKRVYFCCVSSDIDVLKLFDYLVGASGLLHGWKYRLYNDVLHLYKAGTDEHQTLPTPNLPSHHHHYLDDVNSLVRMDSATDENANNYKENEFKELYTMDDDERRKSQEYIFESDGVEVGRRGGQEYVFKSPEDVAGHWNQAKKASSEVISKAVGSSVGAHAEVTTTDDSNMLRISSPGAQEVFVFDFGAVVFWGFSRGEETNLLKTIRMFVTKGFVEMEEFQSGEDDMAFVTTETKTISIANDVISLPEDSM